MRKISEKEWGFLFKATAFILLFGAFMHAIAPLVDPNRDRITEVTRSIVPVNAKEVAMRLADEKGRPTLLFIYASWCGYCKHVMPEIMGLKKEKKLEKVNTVFLSLDEKRRMLGQYLFTQDYQGLFTPYVLLPQAGVSLVHALRAREGSFNGAIPYTAVFDAGGALLSEDNGVIDRERLLDMLSATR